MLASKSAPLVIGVAGASGSGKTALADALAAGLEAYGKSALVVSSDWFYRAPVPAMISAVGKGRKAWMQQLIEQLRTNAARDMPAEFAKLTVAELITALETQLSVDAGTYNWDEPAAVDLKELSATITTLRGGNSVEVAVFNFSTRQRDLRRTLQPADVVIVEGLFAFTTPALESAVDVKVFVDASRATTWARKLARDSQDGRGGHDEVYLRRQFEQAWAMKLLHVAPAKEFKGVHVVRNDEDADLKALVEHFVGHVVRQPSPARLRRSWEEFTKRVLWCVPHCFTIFLFKVQDRF